MDNSRTKPKLIQIYEIVHSKKLNMAVENQSVLNYLQSERTPVSAAITCGELAAEGRTVFAILEPDPINPRLEIVFYMTGEKQ